MMLLDLQNNNNLKQQKINPSKKIARIKLLDYNEDADSDKQERQELETGNSTGA